MEKNNSSIIVYPNQNYYSLMDLIEAAFKDSNARKRTHFKTVAEIIRNNNNSAEFIREVLQDEDYHTIDPSSEMYEFAKNRATHSVLTFFVGLIFLNYWKLGEEIKLSVLHSAQNTDVEQLWMITSLYHDWGYYSEYTQKGNLDFHVVTKYYLLTDQCEEEKWMDSIQDFSSRYPHVLAYTYQEIEAYEKYARVFHAKRKDDTEKIDHGILGGILKFDRLAKKIKKSSTIAQGDRLLFAKIACLTIAQHNIFKSNSKQTDVEYGEALLKLHSTSDFRISMDTPLLLLMSLVDTFECIKRFGKEKNIRSLQKRTILKNIYLNISQEYIHVNYFALAERVHKKRYKELEKTNTLLDCFKHYKDSLCGISEWTTISTKRLSNEEIVIRNILFEEEENNKNERI